MVLKVILREVGIKSKGKVNIMGIDHRKTCTIDKAKGFILNTA